ncbi:class I SAM-dependent methyltransferase [Staphylococcus caledonicus]|uniref:class I SAM-dependent methyltransferase n=1 Tax=Staphylococcus caledonicus TaxID=2741333 RepID=UPI003C2B1FDD
MEIFKYLRLPKPFEVSKNNIWTTHKLHEIVKMAYLNSEMPGGSCDDKFIKRTTNLIDSLNLSNKTVLDIGCGIGKHTYELGKLGYSVTGIDISEIAIKYAKEKFEKKLNNIEFINKDIFTLNFKEKYDFCLISYYLYSNFSLYNRNKLLKKIYSILNDGGMVLLDVPSTYKFQHIKNSKIWEYENRVEDPFFQLSTIKKYNNKILLKKNNYFFKSGEVLEFFDWEKHFSKQELSNELGKNSFISLKFYSNIGGTNFFSKGDHTIAILAKKL